MGNAVIAKKLHKLVWMSFLALSLVSCSRPLTDLQAGNEDVGFTYCDGTLGSFDVYVVRVPDDYTLFELYVIPVEVADSGPGMVSIAYNDGSEQPPYRTLINQTTFVPSQELFAGYLTENDLLTYDILALTQNDGSGRNFNEQTGELDALCTLPLPGEGTTDTQTSLVKKQVSRKGRALSSSRTAKYFRRNAAK